VYFIRDYDGPEPYRGGSSPDVLILGQDPTVDQNTRFARVLGLEPSESSSERESSPLQNYIFNKILAPLGINRTRIIATNLVNLYYYDVPNRKIAKRYQDLIVNTAKREGIDVGKYPNKTNGAILHALNFKARTQRDFEEILKLPSICHLITLGEPVFQVLMERYNLDLPPKIKEVLQTLSDKPPIIHIGNREVSLLPLPHIFYENSPRWHFYTRFIDENLPLFSVWYM